MRELPAPAPDPGPAETVRSLAVEVPDGAELTWRIAPLALADDRVRRVLEGKRHAVLGATTLLDDKRRGAARTLLFLYDYSDNHAYEVSLSGPIETLKVAEVRRLEGQPPLSDEEIEHALRIARADVRVAGQLRDGDIGFVLLTSDVEPGDRHYGRRRAYVGFGPADERLPRVRAIVDLGDESVVETREGGHE
ncbi:hypothetical protein [Streptomyces sp. NPDC093568]|uniref:hypothetical protein n=1 Tax=Streptomyces sp. NPDC093568 TaxID=3366041 RepID=UPI00381EB9EB